MHDHVCHFCGLDECACDEPQMIDDRQSDECIVCGGYGFIEDFERCPRCNGSGHEFRDARTAKE